MDNTKQIGERTYSFGTIPPVEAVRVEVAVARVIGETAPLLITVGLTLRTNTNPVEGSMATLPVLVYDQYSRGGADNMERAWAGALTLIIIVMLLNLVARLISRYFSPKGGKR